MEDMLELLKERVTAGDSTFLEGLGLGEKEQGVLWSLCGLAVQSNTLEGLSGAGAYIKANGGYNDAQITHLKHKGLVDRANPKKPGCSILPKALQGLLGPTAVKSAYDAVKPVKKTKKHMKAGKAEAVNSHTPLTSLIHKALMEKAVEGRIVVNGEVALELAKKLGTETNYISTIIGRMVRRQMFDKQTREGKTGYILKVLESSERSSEREGQEITVPDQELKLEPKVQTKLPEPPTPPNPAETLTKPGATESPLTVSELLAHFDRKISELDRVRQGKIADYQEKLALELADTDAEIEEYRSLKEKVIRKMPVKT